MRQAKLEAACRLPAGPDRIEAIKRAGALRAEVSKKAIVRGREAPSKSVELKARKQGARIKLRLPDVKALFLQMKDHA